MNFSAYQFIERIAGDGKAFLRLIDDRTGQPHGVTMKLSNYPSPEDFNAKILAKSEEGFSVTAMVSESAGGDAPLRTRLLWADADWKDYPGGKAQLDDLIARVEPAPSLVVQSGHGNHLYWFLDRAVTTSTARELAKSLAWSLGTGPTYAPNQKMRVPGTMNMKNLRPDAAEKGYTEPVPCRVVGGTGLEHDPNAFGRDETLLKLPHKLMTRLVRGPESPATEDKSAYDYQISLQMLENGLSQPEIEHLLSTYPGSGKAAGEGYNKRNYVQRTITAAVRRFSAKGSGLRPTRDVTPVVWTRKTYKELLEAPRPAFLIQDFLPSRGIALIAAPPKARKSWAAMQLAHSLATGQSWLGFDVPEAKRVLYVQAELPDDVVAARFEQMYGRDTPVENLQFIRVPAADLTQPEHLQGLLEEVQAFQAELVIIDPIANFWQGDENAASSVNALFDQLAQIQEAGCGVVLVHHSRKTQGHERLTPQHMRGSSVFFARPDAIMTISPTYDNYSWADFTLRAAAPRDALRLYVDNTGAFTLQGKSSFQTFSKEVQDRIRASVKAVQERKAQNAARRQGIILDEQPQEKPEEPVESSVPPLRVIRFDPSGRETTLPEHAAAGRTGVPVSGLSEDVLPRTYASGGKLSAGD